MLLTRYEFMEKLNDIQKQGWYGCGNSGCSISTIGGMKTNGPCRCSPKQFAIKLRDLATMLDGYGHRSAFDEM